MWKYFAKAVGEKASNDNKEADIVATIRLILVLQAFITNFFIIAGVIKHWS